MIQWALNVDSQNDKARSTAYHTDNVSLDTFSGLWPLPPSRGRRRGIILIFIVPVVLSALYMSDTHEDRLAGSPAAFEETLLLAFHPHADELTALDASRQLVVREGVRVPEPVARTAKLVIKRTAPPRSVRRDLLRLRIAVRTGFA